MLVKLSVALKQIADNSNQPPAATKYTDGDAVGQSSNGTSVPTPGFVADGQTHLQPTADTNKSTRFFMSAQLDNTRLNRDVQRLVEEVISHLSSFDGSQADVSLEVTAIAPNGMPQAIIRTVSENCRTLRVTNFGFEE